MKECNFCNNKWKEIWTDPDSRPLGFIRLLNDKLVLEKHTNRSSEYAISYCPKCGRKLDNDYSCQ